MKTFDTLSKTIAFHAATSNFDLGSAGERLAIAMFRDQGFLAKKTSERYSGDLKITNPNTGENFYIEVKTARSSKAIKPTWQFCMNKDKNTHCHYSDYCLLFAVMRGKVVAYMAKSECFSGVQKVTIYNPTTYRGKFCKFKIDPQNLSIDLVNFVSGGNNAKSK